MAKYYIGIDGGATNIKAGIVNDKGKLLHFLSKETQSDLGKKQVVENVVSVIDELLNLKYKIASIGLAWPGKINIPIDTDELKKILAKKYKLKIHSANDADLFTLGEVLAGQGKNKKIVLGITLGTGVGSGLIIDKQMFATEFGHVSLDPKGPKCLCGNRGCIEMYLGRRSLLRRLIKKHTGGNYKLNSKNKKQVLKLWHRYGLILGHGLVNAVKAYRPDTIIIGGNVCDSYTHFEKIIKQEMKRLLKNKMVIVKKSSLKNAAVIGAALYAKQNIK